MNLILTIVLVAIAAAVIAVRRANRTCRRILDGRRWEKTTRAVPVDPDDVLDLLAEAEGITRRAAARRQP